MRIRKSTFMPLVVLVVAMVSGGWFLQQGVNREANVYFHVRLLEEVMQHIEGQFVEEVDVETLYEAAIDGVVGELGDPNSQFLQASDYEDVRIRTQGEYGGVGPRGHRPRRLRHHRRSDPGHARGQSRIPARRPDRGGGRRVHRGMDHRSGGGAAPGRARNHGRDGHPAAGRRIHPDLRGDAGKSSTCSRFPLRSFCPAESGTSPSRSSTEPPPRKSGPPWTPSPPRG